MPFSRSHLAAYLVILLSATVYVWLLYFTPRESVHTVLGSFAVLFAGYAAAYHLKGPSINLWLGAAIGFRAIALFAFPELSDDLYRFLWDGHLWTSGENPFLRYPELHAKAGFPVEGAGPELYGPMNSKTYFTIYPPVSQWVFAAGALLFPKDIYGGVVVMKSFLFLAEIGTLVVIRRLLLQFQLPAKTILLYALNPLIIVEFCGNTHFEGLMIFFLLGSLWFAAKGSYSWSAGMFALSICTKLIPIMFLPFFIARLGWKRSIGYFALVGISCVIFFLPFFDLEMVLNFRESFSLYFQRFEFNAGIFYILRWIGIEITGFDLVRYVGWILSVIVLGGIAWMALREKNPTWASLPNRWRGAQTLHLALSTTVHPWYMGTLVATSLFTRFRYAMVWSGTATLSYYTYRDDTYTESTPMLFIEYGVVAGWLVYEWKWGRKKDQETLEMREEESLRKISSP